MISKIKNRLINLGFKRKSFVGTEYYCPICKTKLKYFTPLPESYKEKSIKYGYPYFGKNEHLNVEKFSCPNCSSSDRDRLYSYYIENIYLKQVTTINLLLLHIAPAWQLNNLFLKRFFNVRTSDLFMENVDDKVNIERMDVYADNYFDFFICSHVLEHVNNTEKALSELYRVLKPGGKGIIMAPIIIGLKETQEDNNHLTEEERYKNYGQEDHLRIFAKEDFIKRIKKAGFNLEMIGINELGADVFYRLGLRDNSILYIGVK